MGRSQHLSRMVAHDSEVPHFAAWSGLTLAIEVKVCVRIRARNIGLQFAMLPALAQQIDHRHRWVGHCRIAKWCTNESSYLLFKLAGLGCIECPMRAVVWPRCNLVNQQLAV